MEGESASVDRIGHDLPILSGRRSSRTASISSDRASLSGHGGLLSQPIAVTPEPAYIAASAASQIVTNDHDSHADSWLESHGIEPSGETALVAPAALKLVNNFLDQLLFNFLSISRSTSLAALRPAVSEVLKPKLAQDAITGADQELHEYLGGNEDDEILDAHSGENANWDLELVWKRTRLRSMVYSSLGDMEEEDEDYYMEHEHLNNVDGPSVVSPAVAIFLTSILEFMGEQALVVAGQAAYHRLRVKLEKDLKDGTNLQTSEIAERVVVDETDMERVALDRTLGRLWRGWKKRVRSPRSSVSINRSFSSDNMMRVSSRNGSISHETLDEDDAPRSIAEVLREEERAAGIPLPIRDGDIREIEVPGLAPRYDDEEEEEETKETDEVKRRPQSMMLFHSNPTPNHSEPHTPMASPKTRQRSFSLPSPPQPTYKFPTPALTEDGASVEAIDPEEPREAQSDTVVKSNEPEAESHKGLVAGLMAGATAVGGAAVAGLKIITSGEGSRPRTADQDEFDDEFIEEEPQIMTSSRVSIGPGSPNIVPSPNPSLRSPSVHSVHSLRLIDVSSPRSPGPSRQSSVDADNRLSRTPSVHSVLVSSELQPNSSPIMRDRQSPLVRSSSGLSVNAGSIAEEREEHDETASDHSSDKAGSTQGMEMARKPTTTDPEKAFILAAAPAARNNREASVASMTPAPLAPLREMTEGTSEIPEESEDHEQRPELQSRSRSTVSERRNENSPTPSKPHSIHKSSSSTSSHRLKPVRTSEDSMPNGSDDKGQSFEQLIRSDQTIQYTLTPQNMREIEGPDGTGNDSPKTIHSRRSRSQPRSTSRSESRAGNINKQTGLYSNPPYDSKSRPATTQSNKSRRNAPQARDARVDRDSIGDFAEFIRSTGPPGAASESIPPRSTPGTPQSHRGANGSSRNASTSLAKPGAQPVLPKRSMSSATRARLQAREAVVPFGDNSTDLIDFIRQGPPSHDNPRIPRSVAPFRTTMDSDQLSGAAASLRQTEPQHLETPGDAGRNSQASTTFSQNTMSSNTALINKKPAATPPVMGFDEDDMMPKRKTRRVKDPYAIDFSDEEDEFGDKLEEPKTPPKPKRQEESLIDFLNNVPPPPQEAPRTTSIFDEPNRNDLKKKASAPSLMSRFRTTSNPTEPVPQIPTTYSNGTRSNPNRKGSISNGYQPKTAPQIQTSTYAKKMESERIPSGKKTATSDLADFFRDSEPPPMPPTRKFVEEEKPMGWSARFLGRRKKSAV